MSQLHQWAALAVIIFATLGPTALIAPLSRPDRDGWYGALRKPRWNPPSWLFAPVWTFLYLAMSVAMWLVWKENPNSVALPLRLYGVQLLLNHAWSPTFFILKNPKIAFGVILALWTAIVATTVCFALRVPLAGQLMLPYLAWVSFASALNYRLWQDNKE